MKQSILLIAISLFYFGLNAQYFELTSSGFINPETGKDYVVLEFPEKSQEDIYNGVVSFINSNYVSPKDVMSLTPTREITLHGIEKKSIRRNAMHVFDNSYTISFQFKDGKLRINAPGVSIETYRYTGHQQIVFQGNFGINKEYFGVYKKNGDLRLKKAKGDLESFANNIVENIVEFQNKNEDDW